jgi:hypothetical protein
MLDWHQGHEEDAVMRKAALRETAMDPVMTWMVQVDWYLHSNITFLVAACAYMVLPPPKHPPSPIVWTGKSYSPYSRWK